MVLKDVKAGWGAGDSVSNLKLSGICITRHHPFSRTCPQLFMGFFMGDLVWDLVSSYM